MKAFVALCSVELIPSPSSRLRQGFQLRSSLARNHYPYHRLDSTVDCYKVLAGELLKVELILSDPAAAPAPNMIVL